MIEFNQEDVVLGLFRAYHQRKRNGWTQDNDLGIMLHHKPTGVSAQCEEHRSQHKNKVIAMEILSRKVETYYIENGYPQPLVKEDLYFVQEQFGTKIGGGFCIIDSESFDEPVAEFLSEEMANDYCRWLNDKP